MGPKYPIRVDTEGTGTSDTAIAALFNQNKVSFLGRPPEGCSGIIQILHAQKLSRAEGRHKDIVKWRIDGHLPRHDPTLVKPFYGEVSIEIDWDHLPPLVSGRGWITIPE